jgi:glycosyltransferase involved in cell wall biosynthesis
MSTMHPRVSVVIPAYNSAAHIVEALASVRRQTLPVQEIIVVDDGSVDETAALAAASGARVITQENAGPAAARNVGIRACDLEWVAFLDADDLWMEEKLERQFQTIRRTQDAGMVCSNYLFFDENGTHRKTGFESVGRARLGETIEARLLRGMFMLTSTVMVRRELLMSDTLFDVTMRCAEDYELFLRLVMRTSVAVVDEPLVAYRRHANSVTTNLDQDVHAREQLRRLCAARPERYPAGAATLFARQEVARITYAASLALRAGNFPSARARARKSLRRGGTIAAVTIWLIAGICDTPLGRIFHHAARCLWTRRSGKYLSV